MNRRAVVALGAMLPLAACAASDKPPEDWAALGRFAADNAAIIKSGRRPDVVFFGDSITERWPHATPDLFTPGRVGRGVSGQTTRHMLVRIVADVIALRPRVVHLMAGTNDVAGNAGPMTVEQTCANLRAMCKLARGEGIDVLLASIPPATRFDWRPAVEPIRPIAAINRWIERFAREERIGHVDYGPALRDAGGGLRPELGRDGVHPDPAGYRAMTGIVEPLLRARGV